MLTAAGTLSTSMPVPGIGVVGYNAGLAAAVAGGVDATCGAGFGRAVVGLRGVVRATRGLGGAVEGETTIGGSVSLGAS